MTQDLAALVAQATPGPWAVEGARHSGDLKIGPNTRLHFVGPDGDAVAAVFFDMKTGQGLPDAKLIAMAPDLAYKVLEQQAEIARLTARAEKAEAALAEVREETIRLNKATDADYAKRLSESQALLAMAYEVATPIRSLIELIEEGEITGLSRTDEFGLYLLGDEQAPVYCMLTLTLEQLGKIGSTNPTADAQTALDARINAAREEGRAMGLREAADIVRSATKTEWTGSRWATINARPLAAAILAKIKEADHE